MHAQIKTVVLHGLGVKTPAVVDEVLKMCVNAQIEHASPGDCAKGASLLLAGSRGLLSALPVGGIYWTTSAGSWRLPRRHGHLDDARFDTLDSTLHV